MSLYFGLIMFLCIVPTLVICFFQMYPKNWQEKKLILGVKNREEFREGEAHEAVNKIYQKCRRQALGIVIVGCIISAILLLLRGFALQTTLWMSFILLALVAISIPMAVGNRELKDLKRRLGLKEGAGISFVDLSNAGNVRALKGWQVALPNAVGSLFLIPVLLEDLGVIRLGTGMGAGSFLGTGIMGTCVGMGLLISALAFLMDGLRNEVISSDSAVNANYNRAKKKNFADFFVMFLWVNVIFMMGLAGLFYFRYSDALSLIALTLYLGLVMVGIAVFVSRDKRIEALYHKDMVLLSDDDDSWVLGMFYYNPKDKRLNVEKRVGVGGTINLAHPMGKVLGGLAALCLLGSVLSVVWICMLESTPIRLYTEEGRIVCHQLRDEYVIEYGDILAVSFGENVRELRMIKVNGVGTDQLLKGIFTVDFEHDCRVFLAPAAGNYIRIQTLEHTYYVSGATAEETQEAYEALLTYGVGF